MVGTTTPDEEGTRRRPHPQLYFHIYLGDAMAQVTIYLDDETAAQMRESARAAGVSMSAWLARLIREHRRTSWPPDVEALAGSWSDDFPMAETLRASCGVDTPREPL